MTNENAPELVMKLATDAPVYLFTLQARNDADAPAPTLSLAQIEAARNAAVAALNLVGAEVDSTSSVLTIAAPVATSRLTLRALIETL